MERPYTAIGRGASTRSASKVDIDHVVSLAEAWRSGARTWSHSDRATASRGERFIQPLEGDSPPQEWKPPRRAVWCLYGRWWVDVKRSWRLTVTRLEKQAMRLMLRTCD